MAAARLDPQRARIHQVVSPAEVAGTLHDLRSEPPDLIAINGGDGTVQSVVGNLLEHRPFPSQPLIAILPAGTTNMTAGDVGLRGRRGASLQRLLYWADQPRSGGEIVTRPVIRVDSPREDSALYGMFFGAAAIIQGIQLCRQNVHTRGIRGEWGPGIAMARVVLDLLLGRPTQIHPERIRIQKDGGKDAAYDSLILFVTSLERLFLGIRPFWNPGPQPLHFTLIRARPRHLMRVIPALARGRHNPRLTPENGYTSRSLDELKLYTDGGFTLDGELHRSSAAEGPLLIRSGGEIRFLRL